MNTFLNDIRKRTKNIILPNEIPYLNRTNPNIKNETSLDSDDDNEEDDDIVFIDKDEEDRQQDDENHNIIYGQTMMNTEFDQTTLNNFVNEIPWE